MRKIGLHLRLTTTLEDLLQKGIRLSTPLFQCFLIKQGGSSYAEFTDEEYEKCASLMTSFETRYLHASYWVNLAGCRSNGWKAFHKELHMGKRLGFTHIIIHPGSATGCTTKQQGIDCLARALDKVLSYETDIKIVLENTAHARMTVGGSIYDFKQLLALVDQPDRVNFCIDTAHAHSYGYDLVNPEYQDIFLEEINDIMGKSRIALLHLNETSEQCGSYIDRHVAFGQGQIGNEALQRFMNHPLCKDIPIILEIPAVPTEAEERALLDQVQAWDLKL